MSLERKIFASVAVPITLMMAGLTAYFAPDVAKSFNEMVQGNFTLGAVGTAYWSLVTGSLGAATAGCGGFAVKELVVDPIRWAYSKCRTV